MFCWNVPALDLALTSVRVFVSLRTYERERCPVGCPQLLVIFHCCRRRTWTWQMRNSSSWPVLLARET